MSGLVVDSTTCVGCGLCVRTCASNGIEVHDRLARPTDNCISCGMCVDACPVGALSIQKDDTSTVDTDSYHDLWVFCQQDDGVVAPVALELLNRGRELACARGCQLVAVIGEAPGSSASQAVAHAGCDKVIRCVDERFASNDAHVIASWLCELATERRPETILYGATDLGRELAPQVAARLGTGLTADCTILAIDEQAGLLQQTRPAFGGNLMATIVCPKHRPQMATVRPGIFAAADPLDQASPIEDVKLDADVSALVEVLRRDSNANADSITDADVLVVVGRGIGSKKALPLMRRLVELLDGKLGCTRPLVEAGWCDYSCQVGQTGVSVAPKLLVSVGVSGAIQHLAGIGGAEHIIAINEDPSAPIFAAATHAVVGDAIEVTERLIEELERA